GHRAPADQRVDAEPPVDHLAGSIHPVGSHGRDHSTGFCYMNHVPRHLVSIADLERDEIVQILDRGDRFLALADEPVKKLPSLRGRTVILMFFESSTRTRTSFEIAAKRLSAEAINISGTS